MNTTNHTSSRRFVTSVDQIPAADVYLTRIRARVASMRRAIVEEGGSEADYAARMETGELRKTYNTTLAEIEIDKDGEINVTRRGRKVAADSEFLPTADEAASIKAAFAGVEWPHSIPCDGTIPIELERVPTDQRWTFKDKQGNIRMLLQRIDFPNGDKVYMAHSYWSDGEWRKMEPEGLLPLFGLEKAESGLSVMVHEGPKSAAAAQKIAADEKHPWNSVMKNYVHLGWHGGAKSAYRTDWASLEGAGRIVIVPDNDDVGYDAVPEIARRLPKDADVFSLRWPAYFPDRFDLAENIPDPPKGKKRHNLRESICPATWATKFVGWKNPEKQTGPIYDVRTVFARQWIYISQEERFINRLFPRLRMTLKQFDAHHRKFSDVKVLSDLTLKCCDMFADTTYLPGEKIGPTGEGGAAQKFNVYTPCNIRPKRGDVTPWLTFLAHLIPKEEERLYTQDWLATLIARPQNRPGHGLLFYSIMHGVGKGTLNDFLEVLLGFHNVSSPSVNEIVKSDFTGWVGYKTLVYCGEIYEGHSWAAYNKMKSLITDKTTRFNEKHEIARQVHNAAWFLINSNSTQCLRIDPSDRRFFIPEVTEEKYTQAEATALRTWFDEGGDAAILYWAQNYEKMTGRSYLLPGAEPPMTNRKKEMIAGSIPEDVQVALDMLEAVADELAGMGKERRFAFSMSQLRVFAQQDIEQNQRLNDKAFASSLLPHNVVYYGRIRVELEGKRSKSEPMRVYCFGAKAKDDTEVCNNWKDLTDFAPKQRF